MLHTWMAGAGGQAAQPTQPSPARLPQKADEAGPPGGCHNRKANTPISLEHSGTGHAPTPHACTYAHAHTHILHAHKCIRIHIHTHMHTCSRTILTHTHSFTHTHTCMYMFTQSCICMLTVMCTHTHTLVYTHSCGLARVALGSAAPSISGEEALGYKTWASTRLPVRVRDPVGRVRPGLLLLTIMAMRAHT